MCEKNLSDLQKEIIELKKSKNAIILAHNYVDGSIQDIADVLGDSLQLSIEAAKLNAPLVVFAGVTFMGETAKILSPNSTVLMPNPLAGCPMADMATAEAVAEYKHSHPDTVLVAYVNSSAAVKAEVDICCTSANAEKIVASIPDGKEIMFLPDKNLGQNIAKKLNRKMSFWEGYCPIHHAITPEMALATKAEHPDYEFLVHPECQPEIVAIADKALSTGGMLKYIRESDKKNFIVGTECGILHRLKIENPDKNFVSLNPIPTCIDMKKITLLDIKNALLHNQYEVVLDEEIIRKARTPIEKMINFR